MFALARSWITIAFELSASHTNSDDPGVACQPAGHVMVWRIRTGSEALFVSVSFSAQPPQVRRSTSTSRTIGTTHVLDSLTEEAPGNGTVTWTSMRAGSPRRMKRMM